MQSSSFVTKWAFGVPQERRLVALPADRVVAQSSKGISIFDIETGTLLKATAIPGAFYGLCALPDADFLSLEAEMNEKLS